VSAQAGPRKLPAERNPRPPSRIPSALSIGLGFDLVITATGAFQHDDSLQVGLVAAGADRLPAGLARRRGLLNRPRSLVLRSRRTHDRYLPNRWNRNSTNTLFGTTAVSSPSSQTIFKMAQKEETVNRQVVQWPGQTDRAGTRPGSLSCARESLPKGYVFRETTEDRTLRRHHKPLPRVVGRNSAKPQRARRFMAVRYWRWVRPYLA